MTVKTMVALAAALAGSAVLADKVTFASGAYLTGTAGRLSDGKLVFVSDDVGEVTVDISKIASLESAADHWVLSTDGSLEKRPVTVAGGAYALRESAGTKPLDMGGVKAIDPDIERWHGSVNLSASATRGNTVGEAATVIASVSRRWERDRLTASAGYYFDQSGDSKATKQKTTSRFEVQAQEDHFWSGSVYSYASGKYEFDRIMDLDYRYRLGAGLGYQWLENAGCAWGKVSFNQEFGLSYVDEKYAGKGKNQFLAARYAHHLAWTVASVDGLAFAHNLEFLPDTADPTGNYLVDADVGLTYAFRANWQLIAKIEWDYQKKVAETSKHSDLRYILGVGYAW